MKLEITKNLIWEHSYHTQKTLRFGLDTYLIHLCGKRGGVRFRGARPPPVLKSQKLGGGGGQFLSKNDAHFKGI